jgi:hypothetical protein
MDDDPGIGLARWAGRMQRECPSHEALAGWIDRCLDITERTSIDRHLQSCAPCRQVVREVIDTQMSGDADLRQTPGPTWLDVARRVWWLVRRGATALASAAAAVLFRV